MNKIIYFWIVVVMAGCTAKTAKPFFRIEGEWICESFEYRLQNGALVGTDTVTFHMRFENCNDKKDNDTEWCTGSLFSDHREYGFKYLSTISSNKGEDLFNIQVDSAVLSPEKYPWEYIGQNHVYYVRYQNKDRMTVTIDDQEFIRNLVTDEIITRPKWVFRKKD